MKELTAENLLETIHKAVRIRTGVLATRKPTRFRRNELKNLARRKGFRLKRVYTHHIGWIYRIERLPYPGCTQAAYKSYEYCKTQFATAAERLALHLLRKPNVSWGLK